MPSIKELKAFNFQRWIEDNKEKLKPPVGNAQVWEDGEMMVTVVGGPNNRRDYHDDPTEEFFYQLKGDIFLRLMETPGKSPLEVPIKEGEIFLLPKHMRHSPQRLQTGTIGVVVDLDRWVRSRPDGHWAMMGIDCEEAVRCGFGMIEFLLILRPLPSIPPRQRDAGERRAPASPPPSHPQ